MNIPLNPSESFKKRNPHLFALVVQHPCGGLFIETERKPRGRGERQLQDLIADYLRLRGICFYRARMDKPTTGRVGWPDFTFALNGQAWALEVKVGDAKPTEAQQATMMAMQTDGWMVRVVRSVDEVRAIVNFYYPNSPHETQSV